MKKLKKLLAVLLAALLIATLPPAAMMEEGDASAQIQAEAELLLKVYNSFDEERTVVREVPNARAILVIEDCQNGWFLVRLSRESDPAGYAWGKDLQAMSHVQYLLPEYGWVPPTETPAPESESAPIIIEETPAVEEPAVPEAPIEEAPAAPEAPAVEETPAVEEAPAVEEPAVEEAPIEEAPAAPEAPAVEEPAVEEAPIEEAPAAPEAPAVTEAPATPAPAVKATVTVAPVAPTAAPAAPTAAPEVVTEDDLPDDAKKIATIEDALNPDRYIDIYAVWDGEELLFGMNAQLIAVLHGYENVAYTLQWQISADNIEFQDIKDATDARLNVTVTEENYLSWWRVQVLITDVL